MLPRGAMLGRLPLVAQRLGARGVAAEGVPGLQCSAKTNVGKLAGALSARLREGAKTTLDSVGPAATYTAIKSIMVAEDYCSQEAQGKVLAVRPEMVKLDPRTAPSGRETQTVAFRLHVALADPLPELDQELTYMSADTNPGLAARLLVRVVEDKGVVPLACMGDKSCGIALRAIMITEEFLGRNNKLGTKALAFHAKKDTFQQGSEERVRILFQCGLVPGSLYK
ncbi:unnamed protein product [Effrenium voratum]|uniref:Uncharacterized protein n=1 Tax=Effrenium voratum TaxID=2562239 RepID=A0AA36J2F3_9DINO|nr:unnamed protein product [Effrenium voratum]CAJ1428875.1 unnamed protein product [Effrenium voratum]